MELLGFAAGPYQTNCYLAVHDGRATVIDPGMHAQPRVEQVCLEQGLEIEQVLLTHGHIDHTRDAAALANKHNVSLYIHQADAFMLEAGEGVSSESQILFDAKSMPQARDLKFLSDSQVIQIAGADFEVRHSPGHSPGSVIFVGEQICISGDVLFQGSIGRTDLPHSDPAAMQKTLAEVILSLSDALQVLPGHGPVTSMRAERRANPFLQEFQ